MIKRQENMRDQREGDYPVTGIQTVWQGKVFSMESEGVLLPGAEQMVIREYVRHPGAVAILPWRENGDQPEILLLRQYRHPVRAQLWEIPAGLLDVADESPLTAAQRELAEEADLQAQTWNVLVDFFTTPGGNTEALRIFLARDVTPVPVSLRHRRNEEEALLEPLWWPLEAALAGVTEGRLHSPSAVLGILAVARAYERNWEGLRPASDEWFR